MNPTVGSVLEEKQWKGKIATIPPDSDVWTATVRMKELDIGSLVVLNREGRFMGLIAERDVLWELVCNGLAAKEVRVADLMVRDGPRCGLETPLAKISALFRDRKVRHLPVIENGRPIGLVSIGDLNAYFLNAQADRINNLETYLYTSY